MTLEESIARDLPVAKNADNYNRMVKAFSHADSKEQLAGLAVLYGLDMRYDRADICLALHTVEIAKGWH